MKRQERLIILIIITSIEFLKEWSVSERQSGWNTERYRRGEKIIDVAESVQKDKKEKKRKKRSNATQAMQYFLPSKTSQQGWNEHRMVSGPRQIFPSYQLSACNKAEVAADRGPPPGPSTLSTGFSSSTTIRNSKAGNFSRAWRTRPSRGL